MFISCQNKEEIKATVYKKGKVSHEFYGAFFSTKYGGLNYYVSDENERNQLFNITNIDSIVLKINNENYICKPIVDEHYSRVINNSDFSFSISRQQQKPVVDRIDNKETLLFYSAKTDLEKLKDDGVIGFIHVEDFSQ